MSFGGCSASWCMKKTPIEKRSCGARDEGKILVRAFLITTRCHFCTAELCEKARLQRERRA
jgi:hypothetical protein